MQASIGGAGAEMIGGGPVEAASPISSRPPVDEFAGAAGLGDEEEPDRGVSGGNRWPRQETLALLRIRSEMDATFRDATLKGPLWEDVSRKLGELGYRRSAKKCKEKFENVHKYYKRTKEGRAGRQDGKTYKFFTELEALNATTTTVSPLPAAVGVAQNVVVSSPSPMPITSISYPQVPFPIFRPAETAAAPPPASAGSFSTDSASTSPMSEDYEGGGSRKRKRNNAPKMVEVLEGMMKKVMAEQEAMQRRFLEAVDKREQERTAREEGWRRQESARLAREHDLLAQERAVSASRDAAIISFLQKLTGQTIPIPSPPTATAPPPPPPPQQQQHHQPQQQQLPAAPALMAVPEQQAQEVSGSMSSPASGAGSSSSRWPKAEVLALIKLRSGLEGRYQEAGPKGPLWEEVSLGMGRMGYKRSSKRCKEKWENINKYFKKVKESNKKRPEDAKTCPYFHQLDALYRNKSITQQQQQQEPTQTITHDQPQNNNGDRSETQPSGVSAANLFGEEATKKPEDIVKDMMMEQQLMVDDYDDKMNDSDEDIGEDEDGEEEDEERNGNMEYKIEFQRPNNNSNGGGNNNEAPSFFAMVQ